MTDLARKMSNMVSWIPFSHNALRRQSPRRRDGQATHPDTQVSGRNPVGSGDAETLESSVIVQHVRTAMMEKTRVRAKCMVKVGDEVLRTIHLKTLRESREATRLEKGQWDSYRVLRCLSGS